MTTQEHHEFCQDVAAVLRKHGVRALTGCWFGKPGKGAGVIELCEPADSIKPIVTAISSDLLGKMRVLIPDVTPKHTKGFYNDPDKNN
jgi:hypothetical protein